MKTRRDMGTTAINNVLASKRKISHAAQAVLILLAHRVNDKRGDFTAFPSIRGMARDARLSTATVQRALKELLAAGCIRRTGERKPIKTAGGKQPVNRYIVDSAKPQLLTRPATERPALPPPPAARRSFPPPPASPRCASHEHTQGVSATSTPFNEVYQL